MKILFIAQMERPSRCWQRARALQDMGYELRCIDSGGGSPARSPVLSMIDKLLWKLRFPRDATGANSAALAAARDFRPELVWIEKGIAIVPRTLRRLKALRPDAKLVSYSEDDMYARHNRSHQYTRGLKSYDVVFTTKSYNCNADELPALGARRVVFVDKGYDKWLHRPVQVTDEERGRLGGEVGFIGSYEQARAQSILFLAQSGILVKARR